MSLNASTLPEPSKGHVPPCRLQSRLSALFLINGLLYASWAVEIPALQARLHLGTAPLSALLFTVMAGNLLALPLIRAALVRNGSRFASFVSLLLLCGPLGLIGNTTSVPAVFVAALLYGMGFGGMDFTLNAVGGWLQERRGQPIMSGLHGMYSLGALSGALTGAALIAAHVPLGTHLFAVSGTGLLIGGLFLMRLPRQIEQEHGSRPTRAPATLALLLIPGFFAAYAEGVVTDWSALYLGDVYGLTHALSAAGLVLFSGLMVAGRFTGDGLTKRYGTHRLMLGAATLAAAGLALITLTRDWTLGAAGFGLIGAGVSVLAPLTFSAAWNLQGSAGVALLTAVFYGGYLAAPPLTGLFTLRFHLSHAFILPLILALASVLAILSRPLNRALQPDPAEPTRVS